ncbi:MAG: hypothetical protein J7M29_11055, partial [Verrucomicrobia bacterium]|nr:hypothetical protein [Verrucomicrobiota bacterium]
LQNRADKQIVNLEQFIRSGTLGKTLKCRAQYHQKTSWRRTSPNPEREKEINWRLRRSESLGLVGELGIHQVDVSNWYMRKLPKAIHGYGSLLQWQDGRDVPDNVVAVLEYPDGTFLVYESTIANSYNAIKQIFFGSNCAILMRDRRAWMFKEADAPLLGWEVYAKRDTFYTETGVVLGAGSTKQAEREKVGASAGVIDPTSALQYSLQNFLINSYNHGAAVADFKQMFEGADRDALADYLKDLAKNRLPAAGYREGYQATVSVIKANEAVLGNKRIDLDETLFRI